MGIPRLNWSRCQARSGPNNAPSEQPGKKLIMLSPSSTFPQAVEQEAVHKVLFLNTSLNLRV